METRIKGDVSKEIWREEQFIHAVHMILLAGFDIMVEDTTYSLPREELGTRQVHVTKKSHMGGPKAGFRMNLRSAARHIVSKIPEGDLQLRELMKIYRDLNIYYEEQE